MQPCSASLLLDDLLLLDVLVLERLELLVTRLDRLALVGLEAVEEAVVGRLQRSHRVVGEVLRLTDAVENPGVLVTQEVEELALEPADVLDRHVVELASGAGPDRDDLVLEREGGVLRLLEQL